MSIQAQPRQLFLSGLKKASAAHKEALQASQWLAEMIGHKQDTVTADDVFKLINPKVIGAAAGGIFRGGPWTFAHWEESTRESNHGRPLRAWRLRRAYVRD